MSNKLCNTGIPTTHIFGPKNGYTWNPVRGCANLECFLHPKSKGGCWAAKDCNLHAIPWARAEMNYHAAKAEKLPEHLHYHPENEFCLTYNMKKGDLKNFTPAWFESQFQKDFPKRRSCIFVFSQTDFAYLSDKWVDYVLDKIRVNNEDRIIAGLPQHIFPFLTKKPDMYWRFCFPDNCWLGFTATTTMEYGDRLDSIFSPFGDHWNGSNLKYAYLEPWMENKVTEINIVRELYRPEWVIVGGQSGKNPQPLNPDWVRSIRDQCVTAGIPFYFKGWGDYRHESQFESGTELGVFYDLAMMGIKGKPKAYDGDPFEEDCSYWKLGKKSGNAVDGKKWEQFPEVK